MINKALAVIIVTILGLSLIGCTKAKTIIDYSGYNESFIEILKKYDEVLDSQRESRITEYEVENVYRCYRYEDGFYFITETYGYEEDMLIGLYVSSDRILKVEVLYDNESEDYGDYVREEWFLSRFEMVIPDELKLVKRKKSHENEVIAITGATITSQAVVDAVNKCIQIMEGQK